MGKSKSNEGINPALSFSHKVADVLIDCIGVYPEGFLIAAAAKIGYLNGLAAAHAAAVSHLLDQVEDPILDGFFSELSSRALNDPAPAIFRA